MSGRGQYGRESSYDQRQQPQQQRRGGGPLGLVFRTVGTGVGIAAEYREHRKSQKLSRENSRQSENSEAGPSDSQSQPVSRSTTASDLPPPQYEDVANPRTERSLAAGAPATAEKKAALKQYDGGESDDNLSSIEDDEEDWRLDEMLQNDSDEDLPSYNQSEKAYGNTDNLVREVLEKHPLALSTTTSQPFIRQPLPCPVILPERRPGKKARGFVHAYAPLLGECSGIDQDTFLSFVQNFHKSSQASPAFNVIFLAATAVGFVPEPICQGVSIALQVAAGTGEELQTRQRTNDYLDKMNDQLFKPAGLYAMIVKYQSEAEVAASSNSLFARLGVKSEVVNVNTNQSIAKYDRSISTGSSGSGGMSQKLQKIRLASGTTKGAVYLPEAAELIFPDVDKALANQGPETFKDKAADAKNFLADYMDRRAQMKYAQNDPNSSLIVPESQRTFRSKLADPNHPMFNSGPIGFISGGALASDPNRRQDQHARQHDKKLDRYERRMDQGRDLSRKQQRRYDQYRDEEMRRYGDYGYDSRRGYGGDSRNQRRGPGGPIGLVGGLIHAAVSAPGRGAGAAAGGSRRSGEYDDAYDNRPAPHAPYGGARRSFEDRDVAYPEQEPYESSGMDSRYGNRPAPYGGRSQGRQGGGGGGPIGIIKRVMKEDVLYLMIVNMPSEEELAEARRQMEMAKQGLN